MDTFNTILLVLTIVMFLIMMVVQYCKAENLHSSIEENKNASVFDDSTILLARNKEYIVRFYRQSGNQYKESEVYTSYNGAINSMRSTIKRTRNEFGWIEKNTSDKLAFRFLIDRSKKQSGKKLGSITITEFK